jgi:hypothetical protein
VDFISKCKFYDINSPTLAPEPLAVSAVPFILVVAVGIRFIFVGYFALKFDYKAIRKEQEIIKPKHALLVPSTQI